MGKPIFDHDNIPEPGYDRKKDPLGSVLDERIKEFETGKEKGIPWEDVKKGLEKKWGPFDEERYRRQVEEERVEKERMHAEAFIGLPTLEEIINKIYSDYREHIQRDRDENPWKYNVKGYYS